MATVSAAPVINLQMHQVRHGLCMTSVEGCADSTSEGKAYDARLAGSVAGMLELPRATFKPNLGTVGGLHAAAPCTKPKPMPVLLSERQPDYAAVAHFLNVAG